MELYHTQNRRGTTTQNKLEIVGGELYHTQSRQGTTTVHNQLSCIFRLYHTQNRQGTTATAEEYTAIIPHTEPAGNYNYNDVLLHLCANYITHRTDRELQQEEFEL